MKKLLLLWAVMLSVLGVGSANAASWEISSTVPTVGTVNLADEEYGAAAVVINAIGNIVPGTGDVELYCNDKLVASFPVSMASLSQGEGSSTYSLKPQTTSIALDFFTNSNFRDYAVGGFYTVSIPAGAFKIGDEDLPLLDLDYYVVVPEPEYVDLTIVSDDCEPAIGSECESLGDVFVSFEHALKKNPACNGLVTLERDGEVIATLPSNLVANPAATEESTPTTYWGFFFGHNNEGDEYTEPGTYVVNVPEGFFYDGFNLNTAFKFEYKVVSKEPLSWVINPENGSTLGEFKEFTITFNQNIKVSTSSTAWTGALPIKYVAGIMTQNTGYYVGIVHPEDYVEGDAYYTGKEFTFRIQSDTPYTKDNTIQMTFSKSMYMFNGAAGTESIVVKYLVSTLTPVSDYIESVTPEPGAFEVTETASLLPITLAVKDGLAINADSDKKVQLLQGTSIIPVAVVAPADMAIEDGKIVLNFKDANGAAYAVEEAGAYTLNIPKGVFTANGAELETSAYSWEVTVNIPFTATAEPAIGSTVESLGTVTVNFNMPITFSTESSYFKGTELRDASGAPIEGYKVVLETPANMDEDEDTVSVSSVTFTVTPAYAVQGNSVFWTFDGFTSKVPVEPIVFNYTIGQSSVAEPLAWDLIAVEPAQGEVNLADNELGVASVTIAANGTIYVGKGEIQLFRDNELVASFSADMANVDNGTPTPLSDNPRFTLINLDFFTNSSFRDYNVAGNYKVVVPQGAFMMNDNELAELTLEYNVVVPAPEFFDLTYVATESEPVIGEAVPELGDIKIYFDQDLRKNAACDGVVTLSKDGTVIASLPSDLVNPPFATEEAVDTPYWQFFFATNNDGNAYAENGTYTVTIPAGYFYSGWNLNNKFEVVYNVVVPEVNWDIIAVDPEQGEVNLADNELGVASVTIVANGTITEGKGEIQLFCNDELVAAFPVAQANIDNGTPTPYSEDTDVTENPKLTYINLDFYTQSAFRAYNVPGNYLVMVPPGAFQMDGKDLPVLALKYTVVAPEPEYVDLATVAEESDPVIGEACNAIGDINVYFDQDLRKNADCHEAVTLSLNGNVIASLPTDLVNPPFAIEEFVDTPYWCFFFATNNDGEAYTEPGQYTVTIPQGFFYTGWNLNNKLEINYVVVPFEEPTISVPGEVNKDQLESVTLTFPEGASVEVKDGAEVYLYDENYNVIGSFTVTVKDNVVTLTASEEVMNNLTESGTYTIVVPAGTLTVNGVSNPALNFALNVTVDSGISQLIVPMADSYNVFTMGGACVVRNGNRAALNMLEKGIYIVNGVKVVIRK